jgi:DNA-binding CsgD family transcriptional regulator
MDERLSSRRCDDPALATWLPMALLQELRSEGALMISLELTSDGPLLSTLRAGGAVDPTRARRELERLLSQAWQRSQKSAILRPSAASAGTVRTTGDFGGLGEDAERLRECFDAIGAKGKHTLRTCVADEQGTLLAALLCFRPTPFEPQELNRFNELVPGIRAKAIFERQVGAATLAWSGLGSALDAIPSAAFLMQGLPPSARRDESHHIVLANQRGWDAFDRDAKTTLKELAESCERSAGPYEIRGLAADGASQYRLAIHRFAGQASPLEARVALARQRWHLTAREAEVLALLPQGETPKTMARGLGISARTAQFHISSLLAKAKVTSRVELVSALWLE